VKSAVNQKIIVAYFNSGVIFSKSESKLFTKWLFNFESLIQDERAYHLPYMQYHFLEQPLLSATILQAFPEEKMKILTNSFNYPLNFHS